jgi:hypothetical protein
LQIEGLKESSFLKRFFINRKLKIRIHKLNLGDLIDTLDNLFYIARIKEIKHAISNIENFLKTKNYADLKERYMQVSMEYFICKLKDVSIKNSDFDIATYKNDFANFQKRYPVILSTSYAILGSLPNNSLLDYVIFDEASQSDLLSSVLALNCAKNLIIVGDSKQLPEIAEQRVADYSKSVATRNNISCEYWYHAQSILSSVKKAFPTVATTFLKEHYRCQPQIINFCNQKFYNGELVIMTKTNGEIPFHILHTATGNHARKNPHGSGLYNQREIDEIVEMHLNENDDVGVISPFRYQADLISKALNKKFECDTVHKFQGRQKEHIILSTVLNSLNDEKPNRVEDFVNDPKLLNVAISRAAKKLTLIVSDNIYNSNSNTILHDLIKYVKYQSNSIITSGGVLSVFDILYNAKELTATRNQFLSEIVFKKLLAETIKPYSDLGFAMHVPLRRIFTDIKNDDIERQKYLTHPLTHVDFLIFNRITHEPKFTIEVDGTAYHEKNPKQTNHDTWKDECFNRFKIPLLRLKTNGSNEKAKILTMLNAQ